VKVPSLEYLYKPIHDAMDSAQFNNFLRGDRISFSNSKSTSLEYAQHLDSIDPLRHFRDEFLVPSKADLKDPHPEWKPISELNGSPSCSSKQEAGWEMLMELVKMPQIHVSTSAATHSACNPAALAPSSTRS